MSGWLSRRTAAACCVLALDLGASSARADTAECNTAYVEAQKLRRSGRLKNARRAALACAQDTCSVTVRRDCSGWLEDIVKATPSIVIEARDATGNELVAVRVFLDDALLAERLDGQALSLDPGAHELRFEHGGEVRTQRLVALEGQAYRRVSVRFEPPPSGGAGGAWLATSASAASIPDDSAATAATASAATASAMPASAATASATPVSATPAFAAPGAAPASAAPLGSALGSPPVSSTPGLPALEPWRTTLAPEPSGFAGPIPFSAYVLGGIGVASLSVFAVLATSAYVSERDLRNECGRRCGESRVDSIRDRYLIADVALGFGAASFLAAGALWALTPPARLLGSTKAELQLGLHTSRVSVSGRF
jgi:hypothetical protein